MDNTLHIPPKHRAQPCHNVTLVLVQTNVFLIIVIVYFTKSDYKRPTFPL